MTLIRIQLSPPCFYVSLFSIYREFEVYMDEVKKLPGVLGQSKRDIMNYFKVQRSIYTCLYVYMFICLSVFSTFCFSGS